MYSFFCESPPCKIAPIRHKNMKILNKEVTVENSIIGTYFIVTTFEIIAELYSYKPALIILKPSMSILLLLLYFKTSTQRSILFLSVILFSLITNVFFIFDTESMLFFGLVAFFIHRLLMIYFILKLINLRDFIPLLIGMIPFLFIFFYLLSISSGISERSYGILIVQNILISIIAGICFSDYVMFPDNKHSTWLFIFGLLSISQYFIVFIEKYYLSDLSPVSFRPLAMILNAMVYFAFYRLVMVIERSNDN